MYLEDLPPQCPPASASLDEITEGWRYLKRLPASDDQFISHAKLGKLNIGIDPCEFSSCSLFDTRDKVIEIMKLPKARTARVVCLSIPRNSGKSIIKPDGHIDFWAFSGFCFVNHIKTVI